ncbi:MAG: hypothetical protein Q9208_001856 [Pyrenodesmia sp. 3 TL-2023]
MNKVRSGYLETLPHVEVQVPWVPAYVPATRSARNDIHWRDDFSNPTARQLNGSVISRFIKGNGFIGFTVRIGSADDKAGDEVDVDLAKIYDYVTPEELERFENLDWEEEIERERNRPKVGRPRKALLNVGGSSTTIPNAAKKPLGRPRKYPLKAAGPVTQGPRRPGKRVDTAFLGVHIPSPVKAGQMTVNAPSSDASTSLVETQKQTLQRESTASSVEAASTSAEGDTTLQIDQLTPSNAKRVVGVRIPEKSPLKRTQRESYPMVEAALGKSDSSTSDEAVPESGSEDELALKPSIQSRRFANGTEIPNSRSGTEEHGESLFVSETGSSDDETPKYNDRKTSEIGSDSRSIVFIDESADSDTPEDILEKFKASNARRIQTGPAENTPTVRSRSSFIDQYFQPKRDAQIPVPSMTPRQPSASSYSRAGSLAFSQIRPPKSTLSHRTTPPSQAPSSTQRQQKQLKTPRQLRPPGKVGTNVHSAVAGISTTNALSLLEPPPPNAQPGSQHAPWMRLTDYEMAKLRKRLKKNAIWLPSENMIRRELADAGRGPDNYRRAKTNSEASGVSFLDVDDLASRPPGLRLRPGEISADSLAQTSLSNRGIKLNEARRIKREAQLKAQRAAEEAAIMLEGIASKAHKPGSDLATASSVRPGTTEYIPSALSAEPPHPSPFSPTQQSQQRPFPSPHKQIPKQSQSHQPRKSMTPHFPPSRARHQGAISPVLRGGINHLAASNRSPLKLSRHSEMSNPVVHNSLVDNRDQKNASMVAPTKASPLVNDGSIKLGSPITTSDEDSDNPTHPSSSALRPPQLAKPIITLGSPETSPSSSENTHQRNSARSTGKANLLNGHHGRKRHRSSDGSNDDDERPWYQMVRR